MNAVNVTLNNKILENLTSLESIKMLEEKGLYQVQQIKILLFDCL